VLFLYCSRLALEHDDEALESKENHQWILELAIEKSQRLQSLSRVELTDHDDTPYGQFIEWRYPVDVKLAFDAAEVHLSVMLCSER